MFVWYRFIVCLHFAWVHLSTCIFKFARSFRHLARTLERDSFIPGERLSRGRLSRAKSLFLRLRDYGGKISSRGAHATCVNITLYCRVIFIPGALHDSLGCPRFLCDTDRWGAQKKGRRQREGESRRFRFSSPLFSGTLRSAPRQFISRCDIAGTIIPRVTLIEKWIPFA